MLELAELVARRIDDVIALERIGGHDLRSGPRAADKMLLTRHRLAHRAASVVACGSLDGYRVSAQRRAQRRRQRLFRLIVLAWFHDYLLKLPSVSIAALTSIRQLPV